MTLYDIIGTAGVVIILYTYGMLHLARMKPTSLAYSVLNLVGSLMILYSLYYQWNLASFIIEVAWTAMSLYGVYNYYRRRKQLKP